MNGRRLDERQVKGTRLVTLRSVRTSIESEVIWVYVTRIISLRKEDYVGGREAYM